MSDSSQVAVVTGGNRGLGLETCRQLAQRGITVVLTSRSSDKGQVAVRQLHDDGLDVQFHVLDVTDSASVKALVHFLESQFRRLDILVNNAGVFIDSYDSTDPAQASIFSADIDTIRKTLETNTYGALRVARALIPLMNGRGNIVNVSSGMGQLSDMNGCCPAYRLSKTALNAVTRIFADELKDSRIRINSVCPGWVQTDMGGPNADRSVAEGATGIVWAACLPEDGPTGGFFRDGQAIPW
jgi:NAD(P)-dependent dehydrogenase (short-subunit alcohol dehydrogenase family)